MPNVCRASWKWRSKFLRPASEAATNDQHCLESMLDVEPYMKILNISRKEVSPEAKSD